MTKTEQRVALAQDVIKQLTKNRIRAVKGKYVGGAAYIAAEELYDAGAIYDAEFNYIRPNENKDVRDLLNGELKTKTCSVCAKGALFLAHILRNDKVVLSEFISPKLYRCRDRDSSPVPAFTDLQLDQIEMLYESDRFFREASERWSDRELDQLKAIRKKLPTEADKRLKAIMRIIIKNKGQKVI